MPDGWLIIFLCSDVNIPLFLMCNTPLIPSLHGSCVHVGWSVFWGSKAHQKWNVWKNCMLQLTHQNPYDPRYMIVHRDTCHTHTSYTKNAIKMSTLMKLASMQVAHITITCCIPFSSQHSILTSLLARVISYLCPMSGQHPYLHSLNIWNIHFCIGILSIWRKRTLNGFDFASLHNFCKNLLSYLTSILLTMMMVSEIDCKDCLASNLHGQELKDLYYVQN